MIILVRFYSFGRSFLAICEQFFSKSDTASLASYVEESESSSLSNRALAMLSELLCCNVQRLLYMPCEPWNHNTKCAKFDTTSAQSCRSLGTNQYSFSHFGDCPQSLGTVGTYAYLCNSGSEWSSLISLVSSSVSSRCIARFESQSVMWCAIPQRSVFTSLLSPFSWSSKWGRTAGGRDDT